MKATFVKEKRKIYFRDRNGAMWSAECIDDLFIMVHLFNEFLFKIAYYKSERVDCKDYYEDEEQKAARKKLRPRRKG
jgi:hypothetical protein